MISRYSFYFFCAVLLAACINVGAQNSTSSPYSIFGIGEIETRDFGRTTGMGNVGIGMKSVNFLNRSNPAGLSGIDTLTFILDFTGALKLATYSTKTEREHVTDFNFKNLSVGFRVAKRWTTSVGLSPYSSVGYDVVAPQAIEGTSEFFNVRYTGDGGINQFYWGNAIELFRGFSLGVSAGYYFGSINANEDASALYIQRTSSVNKVHFDFGLQYSRLIGHSILTVGGIYGYQDKIKLNHHETVSSGSSVLKDQGDGYTYAYIPTTYGFGFSLSRYKNRSEWVIAADYKYQNWGVDHSLQSGISYTNSHLYSVGIQVTPKPAMATNYLQIMRYQIGGSYNQSYLKVNGHQVDDYSLSVGVGLPFRNRSYINIAANFGHSASGGRGGIVENYTLISVNLSLIELWFAKRKYD